MSDTTGAGMNPEQVIAAGGIASHPAEASDSVDAIAFVHPALPGRVVVRLVAENLADGAAREMSLAGFVVEARRSGVGYQRRRSPGFPAWALVHDPKNARYALEVMKGFAAAKKRIATKPGHARDAFAELAVQLGRAAPHFLPSFWEEAGRAFVAGGAIAMAASSFEKARAAEREHGLKVDEDARAASFLEFAIAGALSVKTLLAWPAELKKSQGPEAAFVRLYDLALRRTLGGRAPWASLPKDLRDAAKACKRDPAAEEGRFVTSVLGAVALRRAPIGFWKEVSGSVGAAAADPAVARNLARLFPTFGEEDEITLWIGLLDRWGVTAHLISDCMEGGLAGWMGKALEAWDDAPVALAGLAVRLAPRLVLEGHPVAVMGEEVWRVSAVDAFEALLAAGVRLEPKDKETMFALGSWAGLEGERHDPVHLAADPVLGPILRESALNDLDDDDFQKVAPGMSAFREVRRQHLVDTVGRFDRGGLPDLEEAMDELENKVPGSTLAEFPVEAEGVAGLDVAGSLARTLRGGVLDELGWPAFDEAIAELRGPTKPGAQQVDVEVHTMAPWAVVTDGRRALVLGPAGREAAFDLKLPKDRGVEGFRWVGGQLLVTWRDPSDWNKRQGYWSGKPKEILTIDWGHGDAEASTPPRGGIPGSKSEPPAVLAGRRILRPGDTTVDSSNVYCDAEGVWVYQDGRVRSVDPATGVVGPIDAPAFLIDRDGVSPEPSALYLPSVPGSPLGAAGPQYGWASFDLDHLDPGAREAWLSRHAPRALRLGNDVVHVGLHLDGRAVVADGTPLALLTWPGSADPRVLVEAGWREPKLRGSDGSALATLGVDDSPYQAGTSAELSLRLWHHLRPRDLAGSQALRQADPALASRLLALAEGLDSDGLDTLSDRIRGVLPITHPALARGIAGIVLHAAGLSARLDVWRGGVDAAAAVIDGPLDDVVRAALSGLTRSSGNDEVSVVGAIRSASTFLHGGDIPLTLSDIDWRPWLSSPLGPAFVYVSPCTSEAERTTIAEVLKALASFPAARRVKLRAPRTAVWLKWVEYYGDKELADAWTWVDPDTGARAACYAGDTDDDFVTVDVLLGGAPLRPPGTSPLEGGGGVPGGAPLRPSGTSLEGGGGMVPGGAVIVSEEPVPIDAAVIETILAAEPAVAVGDAVYSVISDLTGLGRAEAAWIWAGLRGVDGWQADPLGKGPREQLGLKTAEVKAARPGLTGTTKAQRALAYHRALVGWDPADRDGLPGRVGQAWAATFGKRAWVDEALLARARTDFPGREGPEAVIALAGLGTEASYQTDADWKIDGWGDVSRAGESEATAFDSDALVRGVGTLLWVYANTPDGDPIRAMLPALHATLLARVAHPGLLMPLVSGSDKPLLGWFKRFDGAAFTPADVDPEVAEKDRPRGKQREGIYAVSNGEQVGIAVRPCELTAASRDEIGKIVSLDGGGSDDGWVALELLSSAGVAAIVGHCSSPPAGLPPPPPSGGRWPEAGGGLPIHSWPQNPAPDVVAAIATRLKLDQDAAVLYLQLLALYNPTKANVLLWNGWKPATYAKAVAALTEKQLVVEAKRARAGRDHFLPGGWQDRKSGSLPLEEWKLRWYTLDGEEPQLSTAGGARRPPNPRVVPDSQARPPLNSILPLQPFDRIFREALTRILAGDVPRYEKQR